MYLNFEKVQGFALARREMIYQTLVIERRNVQESLNQITYPFILRDTFFLYLLIFAKRSLLDLLTKFVKMDLIK
jgi:hypothetical protein